MAQLIPQSFIDELLARVDLVDVVSNRIKLKKTGKNYSACCPFHNEKTPSFSVSPDKQFFYCFGCGCSGTAIKFVMDYDGLSFPDAVEKLAAGAGLEVPKEQASRQEIQQQQEQAPLFELMQKAGEFYEQMLRTHEQKAVAVNYLKGRGLSGQAAKFFGIGYAPSGWDNLLKTLNPNDDKKITKQLISCGMLIESEDGRIYDRFRDRVMFPIRDVRGRYIAFGGRVLTDEKPKYLNSPETPIFHKGQELYGLFEARKIRQKLTRVVIVEGYMDVVALAEYGIHYALATLGTATSEHHLRRLFKMVPEVIFCFDGDNAGRSAAERAMEISLPLLEDGLQIRFLFLPEGEDPDTLVRQEGKEAFEQRLNHAIHLPEFLFQHIKAQVDFDSLNGKARFDQLAAPLISRLPHGTLRSLMAKQLENEIGTHSSAMEKIAKQPPEAATPQPIEAPVKPKSSPTQPEKTPAPNSKFALQVQKALQSLICNPALANKLELPELDAFTQEERLLIELIKDLQATPQANSVGLLIHWTGSPFWEDMKRIVEDNLEQPASAADIDSVLMQMNARKLQEELNQIDQRYKQGIRLTDIERERQRNLQKQLQKIQGKRGMKHFH